MMMDTPVDEKCRELAEHFLADVDGTVTPADCEELAEQIQKLCEDFCQAIEDVVSGGIDF